MPGDLDREYLVMEKRVYSRGDSNQVSSLWYDQTVWIVSSTAG